ncbi:MAG: L-rhamnose mutarotase [Acidimicrobiia bacterium]|nr:L-rhamnose mutarotase [Acidimicrobiia bacterium]
MESMGLLLRLKPGAYQEYKRRHDELWPELAQGLEANQISMMIYHFDGLLFVHEVAASKDAWSRMNELPVTARWNQFMAEVLETDGAGNIIFQELPLAFAFGTFK